MGTVVGNIIYIDKTDILAVDISLLPVLDCSSGMHDKLPVF